MNWSVLGLLLLVSICHSRTIPFPLSAPKTHYIPRDGDEPRLSGDLVPSHYDVTLVPFFEDEGFAFTGNVTIRIKASRTTNAVSLHMEDIVIKEMSTVHATSGDTFEVMSKAYNNQTHFYTANLDSELTAGEEYVINFLFNGTLIHDDLSGFYRSSYTDNGETRWLATTQFETIGARRAFPCFDEPSFKATFKIAIGRPNRFSALSNMPLESTEPLSSVPGYVLDHFQETPVMSTYLVACIVSDFKGLQDGNYGVWGRSELVPYGNYSLSVSPRIIDFLEEYLNVSYAMPKMDLAAIPDFWPGAMENWGLVTYNDPLPFYNSKVDTAAYKLDVISVIAHEEAHQWFGNLVTSHWWSDIWLNEGFASFFQYIGVHGVEPGWKYDEQFLTEEFQRALKDDSLDPREPISMNVSHPDEFPLMFDSITYKKAPSVIRMMQHVITPEVFRRGLNRYLNNRAFNYSTRTDLYEALDAQAHEEGVLADDVRVDEIFETWILQEGYPLIKVTRDYESGSAVVTQARYLPQPNPNSTDDHEYIWYVPLSYTTQEEMDFETTAPKTFMKNEADVTLSGLPGEDQFLIVNVQSTGFYRVNYDTTNWKLISNYLDTEQGTNIHVLNRAQLLDDCYEFATLGMHEHTTFLDHTRYLCREVELVPWEVALPKLEFFKKLLRNRPAAEKFKRYVLSLLETVYQDLGFDEVPREDGARTLNRAKVIAALNKYESKDTSQRSLRAFRQWMDIAPGENPIPPNVKETIYTTAVRDGSNREWNFCYQQLINGSGVRSHLIEALCCSQNVAIINKTLDMALTTSNPHITSTDIDLVIATTAQSDIGLWALFDYVTDNLETLMKRFESGVHAIMGTIIENINTEEGLNQVMKFIQEHKDVFEYSLDSQISSAKSRVQLVDKHYDTITAWLNENVR